MRLVVWMLLFSPLLWSQIEDDFEDGNFTENPTWSGDTDFWTVADGQLQSNGPAVTGTTVGLHTPFDFSQSTQEWRFFVNPATGTSSGNFMKIHLINLSEDLSGDGYFVKVGGTPDEISLVRTVVEIEQVLVDGTDGVLSSGSNNPVAIKVTFDNGLWTLSYDYGLTGFFFEEPGFQEDFPFQGAGVFGVSATYSQANAEKYFFDDLFIGEIFVDTEAPMLESVTTLNDQSILLTFSEPIDPASVNVSDFEIEGFGVPAFELIDGAPNQIILNVFGATFPENQSVTVSVSGLSDFAGNEMVAVQESFTFVRVSAFSILITEVFPDPTPVVGLPEVEFIELYNNTNATISLNNWTLSDPSDFPVSITVGMF